MYRNEQGERCKNTAISSHSIQNSGALKVVSEHGHVLCLEVVLSSGNVESPIEFQRKGRSKASVFPGFCKRHDNEIFREIEGNTELNPLRALLLTTYRSICQEIFKKEWNVSLFEEMVQLKSISSEERHWLEGTLIGTRLALKDLTRSLEEYEIAIRLDNYSGFEGWIFHLDKFLPFCCAACMSPEFDADGNKVLPGFDEEWHNVGWFTGRLGSVDVLMIGGFTHNRGQDISGFLRSLAKIPLEHIGEFSLNLSVFYSENTFFNESFVLSLQESDRTWLKTKFQEIVPGEALSGALELFKFKGIVDIAAKRREFLKG